MTRDDILREAMGTVLDEIPRAAQQARDEERAAVVAWLRDLGRVGSRWTAAEEIERGEHRTQEEP